MQGRFDRVSLVGATMSQGSLRARRGASIPAGLAGSEVCGTMLSNPGKLTNRRGSADNSMDCSAGVPSAASRGLVRSK